MNFTGQGQFKFALVHPGAELDQVADGYPTLANGQVTGFTLNRPGSGYDPNNPPGVSISAPSGSGAVLTAVVAPDGSIASVTIDQPGSGYVDGFYGATIGFPPGFTQYVNTAWSNDGSGGNGTEPGTSVTIPVTNGLYSVKLGDTTAGMAALTNGSFNAPLHLRVWFSDGVNGFQKLAPDQPLATAPYAFKAELADFAANSTSANVASSVSPGAITSASFAPGAISPLALNTGGAAPAPGQVLSFTNEGLRWVTGGGGLALPLNQSYSSLGSIFELSNDNGDTIYGTTGAIGKSGVVGRNDVSLTIFGQSAGQGVYGYGSSKAVGVLGVSEGNDGISGRTNAANKSGVFGYSEATGAKGVYGISTNGDGVVGETTNANKSGVYGTSSAGNGVAGFSEGAGSSGVFGFTGNAATYGGSFLNSHANGIALKAFGKTELDGPLVVHGTATVEVLTITGGADLAEPFAMSHKNVGPGSVVVIDEVNPGKLRMSRDAYDKKVAGIVSGADGIRPGISMIQEDMLEAGENVALSGRVYVKANNSAGDIQPGDLLTTSAIPGEAMKASDHDRAQGAILGKAMTSLTQNSGKVLVLVTLQ